MVKITMEFWAGLMSLIRKCRAPANKARNPDGFAAGSLGRYAY